MSIFPLLRPGETYDLTLDVKTAANHRVAGRDADGRKIRHAELGLHWHAEASSRRESHAEFAEAATQVVSARKGEVRGKARRVLLQADARVDENVAHVRENAPGKTEERCHGEHPHEDGEVASLDGFK